MTLKFINMLTALLILYTLVHAACSRILEHALPFGTLDPSYFRDAENFRYLYFSVILAVTIKLLQWSCVLSYALTYCLMYAHACTSCAAPAPRCATCLLRIVAAVTVIVISLLY
jgi:hypothetical protein